jgi:hypothetical protein
VHVLPPACLWEPFDYYDGALTTMGTPFWSGSPAAEVAVSSGVLTVAGGSGGLLAQRAAACAASNGLFAAGIKVRGIAGTGDFFWNVWFDDTAGNNLARLYGGSRIARGRIAGTITPDMVLSGPESWDDLYVEINTAARTSEFFLNGVSYGTLNHASQTGTVLGMVRIERIDRATAAADRVQFDQLFAGSVDASPPQLDFARAGGEILLAWPAVRHGPELESTPDLDGPVVWAPLSPPPVSGGRFVHREPIVPPSRYFRLRRR